ncbi:hypothetical protein [Cohnella cholangitidis]|uniref:Uncharacterized protein n=1 Tax=Cohnella cholangitidis TaxID=2598458 RepID=A0A7G5C3F2_9BACL|nr:hypothetical protein [Cohnella cholangitidis]QMV43736.1 hypothetical protein FPL14_23110 [Cohnella cholangitidis]
MGRKKADLPAEKLEGLDLSKGPDKTVVVWKATRPLTVQEHEELSEKLRFEEKETGLEIILVPFSVEPSVSTGESNE